MSSSMQWAAVKNVSQPINVPVHELLALSSSISVAKPGYISAPVVGKSWVFSPLTIRGPAAAPPHQPKQRPMTPRSTSPVRIHSERARPISPFSFLSLPPRGAPEAMAQDLKSPPQKAASGIRVSSMALFWRPMAWGCQAGSGPAQEGNRRELQYLCNFPVAL